MGLAVSVGITADLAYPDERDASGCRARLDRLSLALAARGVVWREPECRRGAPMRPHVRGFPYSSLHGLRRVLVLVDSDEPVNPIDANSDTDRESALIEECTMTFSSHLLCHSDCAGYYVPVDFVEPIFLAPEDGVEGGGIVGSSHRLLAELRRCAAPIGIQLDDDGSLPDAEAMRMFRLPRDADFAAEVMVWLTLHEACLASIASGCAVVFH